MRLRQNGERKHHAIYIYIYIQKKKGVIIRKDTLEVNGYCKWIFKI